MLDKNVTIEDLEKMIEEKKKESIKLTNKKIVRTYSAGVFYGELESRNGKEGIMKNVMCIYYWAGAATLLQLALEGTKKPNECKFTKKVPRIELTEIIEVIDVTEEAAKNIEGVKVWTL
jgi:hypothetical protein